MGNTILSSFTMPKAMKAMKAMGVMKKKTVSKIAKGRMAKVLVFRGSKEKTWGYDSCLLDQEQERQDREQEEVGVWQEERLDCCRHQVKEGIGSQGLCRNQEGLCSLQEGQGALPMNMHEHAKASAQGVGMSTPFERSCVGWTV